MLDDGVVAIRLFLNEVLCLVIEIGVAPQLHEHRQVAPSLVLKDSFEVIDVQVALCNIVGYIQEVRHELGRR